MFFSSRISQFKKSKKATDDDGDLVSFFGSTKQSQPVSRDSYMKKSFLCDWRTRVDNCAVVRVYEIAVGSEL